MRKLTVKEFISSLITVIVVIFLFNYFNPIGTIYSKIHKQTPNVQECIEQLKISGAEEIAFLFSLMGIEESKSEKALDEYLTLSCQCYFEKADGKVIEEFLNNQDNKPVLDECAQKSIVLVQEKYSAKAEY